MSTGINEICVESLDNSDDFRDFICDFSHIIYNVEPRFRFDDEFIELLNDSFRTSA